MSTRYEPLKQHLNEYVDVAPDAGYLNKLPSVQLLQLAAAGTVKEFPEGSLILAEGEPIKEVHLIRRGKVVVGLFPEISPSAWLYVSGPGTLVDPSALLEPPISPVRTCALTDVEALAVPRSIFVEIMGEQPQAGYQALQSFCSRLSLVARVTLSARRKDFERSSPN